VQAPSVNILAMKNKKIKGRFMVFSLRSRSGLHPDTYFGKQAVAGCNPALLLNRFL
jgi:hypothetical protein